jgi:succinylarginine dihydrolase
MAGYEVNFDGLVGATHHYAGLSFGNEASRRNQHALANPRLAARQGLLKMKALTEMGFIQGVLPPHERPHIATLRQLGFSGSDQQVLAAAYRSSPRLLSALSSASAMWVANAATISPSADCADQRLHITVANLNNKFHRAIEATTTAQILRSTFADQRYFTHHPALPQVAELGDEGAANHNRLCAAYDKPGVEIFVYGREGLNHSTHEPHRYPARQTRLASESIARLHQLHSGNTVFLQQNPQAIDHGVFHNDVIAVTNQQVMFYHQQAFVNTAEGLREIREKLARHECELHAIEVPQQRVSLDDAVATYLFNSQLLSKASGKMVLVVPSECQQHRAVWAYLQELVSSGGPIDQLCVFDLRESMRNGGGPACLRLRVVLDASQLAAVNPGSLLNDALFHQLNQWIDDYYRDRLLPEDLADPALLLEVREGLDRLTQILGLGSLYPFQQV